ncbi:MAG: MoaD/ThiS family protein [Sphingobacteriales bacterium]|nr:MAG: MoaD/ThiS family protein [Sphingobacteriales bacterium]TAF82715.1 MAG: MoaD/ThiS family protein [Sphingobacteriales bacterium]
MTIQTFAALKDYFSANFEVLENLNHITDLKTFLVQQNPNAEAVLNLSRFAVNDTFVDLDFEIKPNDSISIIPPSSGG